jgi:hypothetical protein
MQTKYPVEGGDRNPDGTRSSSGTSPTSTVHVLSLLRRKAITPQRLRLLSEDLDAPARPWR